MAYNWYFERPRVRRSMAITWRDGYYSSIKENHKTSNNRNCLVLVFAAKNSSVKSQVPQIIVTVNPGLRTYITIIFRSFYTDRAMPKLVYCIGSLSKSDQVIS